MRGEAPENDRSRLAPHPKLKRIQRELTLTDRHLNDDVHRSYVLGAGCQSVPHGVRWVRTCRRSLQNPRAITGAYGVLARIRGLAASRRVGLCQLTTPYHFPCILHQKPWNKSTDWKKIDSPSRNRPSQKGVEGGIPSGQHSLIQQPDQRMVVARRVGRRSASGGRRF